MITGSQLFILIVLGVLTGLFGLMCVLGIIVWIIALLHDHRVARQQRREQEEPTTNYQAAGVWPDSAISPEAHARIKQNVDDAMQKYDDEVARRLLSQLDNDSGQGASL